MEEGARAQEIRGLVISSGKERGFIVGADIREFADLATEMDVIDKLRPVTALFDRIERLPVPVVCAINGFCLGGGLELALACHYRIATRDPGTQLGFPEVKLGIFPGFNGTARSIRQAGAPAAMKAMLTGRMLSASAARAIGLVDELVAEPRLAAVGRAQGGAAQAQVEAGWLRQGRALHVAGARSARRAHAQLRRRKKVREDHYPAPFRLIDLFERYGGNEEAMKAAETRAFAPLMVSEQSQEPAPRVLAVGAAEGPGAQEVRLAPSRVHVIGAGTMGADIAGWCVASRHGGDAAGHLGRADREGHRRAGQALCAASSRPSRSATRRRRGSSPTPTGDGLARADVVIEAIVENLEIKQKVLKEVEGKLKEGALLATNTSSLMIEDIAAGLPDPGRLIGLHFFNPVALMPLVEVVRGASSREDEVKRGAAFVAAIDKFPLITKSVPGFLVNRVLTPYMFGAMKRSEQGEDKERIDEAARTFGMPMGPIELADAVGLDVCAHVAKILKFPSEGSRPAHSSSRPASSARRRARASTSGRTARSRSPTGRSTRARWSGSGASSSSR